MKLTRDPRACDHPDLLSPDLDDIAIAWTGDQHYRAVFQPEGNQDTPLLGIYPMGVALRPKPGPDVCPSQSSVGAGWWARDV